MVQQHESEGFTDGGTVGGCWFREAGLLSRSVDTRLGRELLARPVRWRNALRHNGDAIRFARDAVRYVGRASHPVGEDARRRKTVHREG